MKIIIHITLFLSMLPSAWAATSMTDIYNCLDTIDKAVGASVAGRGYIGKNRDIPSYSTSNGSSSYYLYREWVWPHNVKSRECRNTNVPNPETCPNNINPQMQKAFVEEAHAALLRIIPLIERGETIIAPTGETIFDPTKDRDKVIRACKKIDFGSPQALRDASINFAMTLIKYKWAAKVELTPGLQNNSSNALGR